MYTMCLCVCVVARMELTVLEIGEKSFNAVLVTRDEEAFYRQIAVFAQLSYYKAHTDHVHYQIQYKLVN